MPQLVLLRRLFYHVDAFWGRCGEHPIDVPTIWYRNYKSKLLGGSFFGHIDKNPLFSETVLINCEGSAENTINALISMDSMSSSTQIEIPKEYVRTYPSQKDGSVKIFCPSFICPCRQKGFFPFFLLPEVRNGTLKKTLGFSKFLFVHKMII